MPARAWGRENRTPHSEIPRSGELGHIPCPANSWLWPCSPRAWFKFKPEAPPRNPAFWRTRPHSLPGKFMVVAMLARAWCKFKPEATPRNPAFWRTRPHSLPGKFMAVALLAKSMVQVQAGGPAPKSRVLANAATFLDARLLPLVNKILFVGGIGSRRSGWVQ
jgi:hypothetical protein